MFRPIATSCGGAMRALAAVVMLPFLSLPRVAQAGVPLWLHLDNTLEYKPSVDGAISLYPALQAKPGEYFRGRKFELGNWSGVPFAPDAELYLHAIDNGLGQRRLYMALSLVSRLPSNTYELDRGHLEIYLDVDRKAHHGCAAIDDRKIVVNLTVPQSGAPAMLRRDVD